MLTTPTLSPVLSAYVKARPKLEAYLRVEWPQLCRGHIEDAVGAVGLALVTNPTYFMMVHDPQNPKKLNGLFKRVAWCAARATVRRRSFSAERGFEHEDDATLGLDATQPLSLALDRDLPKIVHEEALETSATQATPITAAVLDQLQNGGTDSEVAERHGVRREYLNRTRQRVTRHFISPPAARRRPQKTV
jgi:hypothetical protein